MLLATCGAGLWDTVFPNGQAMHPDTICTWSDRLHPEDAERVRQVFAASVKGGRAWADGAVMERVPTGRRPLALIAPVA